MPFNRIRTIRQFIRGCFKIKAGKYESGKSWQNGEGITVCKYRKIKQEEKSHRGFSKRESN
jgi:hypothetical protein